MKGEIDLACTISTNAREAKANGVDIAWTVPEEGAKYDTDGLWIPKGLPENELYWAKQYINFAITKDAQQVWLDGLGLPGVVFRRTPGFCPGNSPVVGALSDSMATIRARSLRWSPAWPHPWKPASPTSAATTTCR